MTSKIPMARWLLGLVLVGVVIRLSFSGQFEPVSSPPDLESYMLAAQDLSEGSLARSEGRRTPGYPLLIALAGKTPENVILTQMGMGIVISLLLFYITVMIAESNLLGFIVGLSYHVNLQQITLETALLSETMSTFTVVAVVAALVGCVHRIRTGKPTAGLLITLGVLAGLCILVRPQFIFLPLVVPLVIGYAVSGYRLLSAGAVKCALLAVVPMVVIILSWCLFVYSKVGFFTLSTQSGFGLANHITPYIELASDKYATLRQILLKHREQRILEAGHGRNTIWYAWPEIRQTTGMTLPEASRELQRMTVEMIVAHPMHYAISVARAWVDFWTVPIFWKANRFHPAWVKSSLIGIWWLEHKLLRLANLTFLAMLIALACSRKLRERVQWNLDLTVISAIIIFSSVIQALADQGASSRYAVTIQALVLLVLIVTWARFRNAATKHASGAEEKKRIGQVA